jgi:hypothetical protein
VQEGADALAANIFGLAGGDAFVEDAIGLVTTAAWTVDRRFAVDQASLEELTGFGTALLFVAARGQALVDHALGLVLATFATIGNDAALVLETSVEHIRRHHRAFDDRAAIGDALAECAARPMNTDLTAIGRVFAFVGQTGMQNLVGEPTALGP